MSIGTRVVLRVVAVVAAVGLGFWAFQAQFRSFETSFLVACLHLIGAHSLVKVGSFTIVVEQSSHGSFGLIVTPSCSALAPMIAVAGISMSLTPRKIGMRWVLSTILALLVVFVGNIIRMGSSIMVGVGFGTVSLVLFHDWVGSLFGFASVVVGWILLLRFQLPKYATDSPHSPTSLTSLSAGTDPHSQATRSTTGTSEAAVAASEHS